MFDRILKLITKEELDNISSKHILLVGIGGVGGYVLESLIRSGFKHISVVDGDVIGLSNLNRQIIAKMDNLGCSKVLEAKKRVLSINPDANIEVIDKFLTIDNMHEYIKEDYDYIIDACDDVKIKIELIKYAKEKEIPIIVSLGTGRKMNPSLLEVTSLNKTFNDPLAKKLRYELKKQDISLNIPVVFSREEAIDTEGSVGSAIFVPSVAGILMANVVFEHFINEKRP